MTTSNASACEQEGVAPNTTARTQPAAPSDHSVEKTCTIQFDNGDVYEGEIEDGKPHSKGVCRYADGGVYDGEWKGDKRHGRGIYTHANGNVYEGEFENDMAHGWGAERYANGSVYEGNFVEGKAHGKGTKTLANGDVYEGEWKDNVRHGQGTLTYASGNVYEGGWKNDKMHGKGVYKWTKGHLYDGEWKDGLFHGSGTYTHANGDVYEGEFENDNFQGRGTLKEKNGCVYVGDWKKDKRHGKGTQTYSSGNVYEGEFKDDARHGRGTLTSATGDSYEGEFNEGKKHGKDTMTYPSGRIYEGNWFNGKRVYNHELQLRSQRSQQGRLEKGTMAKKTCEKCGVDDYHYKLRVCTGCNLALYCSAACQKAARGSHQRICDIISELPSRDSDRLNLEYDKGKLVDLDAGLRYGTKYMDNLKHLEINVEEMVAGDTVKLSAKRLRSLLKKKKGALDSVHWLSKSNICIHFRGIGGHDDAVWKELHGLKQLRLAFMRFDVQPFLDIIDRQRNTLTVLCLPFLEFPWSKAKCRKTLANAVNSCKHLVKLDLAGCSLTDSDLKVMLNGLPDLRVLHLVRNPPASSHEFTDNTCGLIVRKCPDLQELSLSNHNHLSVRGLRKIFEGCGHLRSFFTSTRKLSCEDVRTLLDAAPQLLYLSLNEGLGIAEEELDEMIEATGEEL